MTRRRVVITGLGCVTPAGNDARTTWDSLLAGRSSIAVVPRMVEAKLHSHIGGELKGFDPAKIGSKQDLRRIARGTQMVLAATIEAWRDAGFDNAPPDRDRAGVYVGTGVGDMGETVKETKPFYAKGARGIHPLFVARVMLNAAPAHASLEFGLRGPSVTTCSACSAGGHAMGLAKRAIEWGDADVMLAGGMEEMSCIFMSAAFDNLRALTTRNDDPEKASRPFDRKRDGFVIAEGAAFVVLEELEHARKRGARILAELAGFGQASDAHHMTAPEPNGEGAILAMKAALADAGLRPDEIQHVNAHGTSTPLNDKMETVAMKRVFGDHARKLAISGTKSMVGHSVGASSAIAMVATVLAMRDGRVHGTMNYEEPDPDCDLDYVPNKARELDVKAAMVNAFGFGGHCISLVVTRHPS
jgi:3-oxoacyl-[acyl-carrier-protein] synthase II